ncbi:MAG: hypothetical protein KKB70_02585 [Proteobacteria bacterium]|nr:hypothetical protein [Pseudomonadota bacterium]MBU1612306.1 hypothetical protein [Pseudomonadota bacterium]
MDPSVERNVAVELSTLMSELLGKGVDWVMTEVMGNRALAYGGSDDPAAFVRLKSIGLKQSDCPELSKAICAFLVKQLSVPQNRVYIEFTDLDRTMFGWDGTTFG